MADLFHTDSSIAEAVSKLELSWKKQLANEFEKPYFSSILSALEKEIAEGHIIYPPKNQVFEAFAKTSFPKVKVIILGQDPYHNTGQAMGLSFSVPKSQRIPPSLRNIFKELVQDIDFTNPGHGDLTSWTKEGVFLLNTILTVRHKSPKSHQKIGWHLFTDTVIKTLSEQRKGLVFMLWGNAAKTKAALIDQSKHLVLEAAHPSPLARGAYFGSKHFSKANEYLKANGNSEIDWSLPA